VPAGGRVLGGNDFCPNAIIAYGDTILTFQPHPEFTVPFLRGLSEVRLKGLAPDSVRAAAETSFQQKASDSDLVAQWIVRFIAERAGGASKVAAE
jgi:GMP synthase (glutamine-hydrolysing)